LVSSGFFLTSLFFAEEEEEEEDDEEEEEEVEWALATGLVFLFLTVVCLVAACTGCIRRIRLNCSSKA
jgi:hypothetical protein